MFVKKLWKMLQKARLYAHTLYLDLYRVCIPWQRHFNYLGEKTCREIAGTKSWITDMIIRCIRTLHFPDMTNRTVFVRLFAFLISKKYNKHDSSTFQQYTFLKNKGVHCGGRPAPERTYYYMMEKCFIGLIRGWDDFMKGRTVSSY